METWSSYRLQDFLLFSQRVYARMFEAHYHAWWPLPLLFLFAGFALASLWVLPLGRRASLLRRVGWLGLGALWGFVAITFLDVHYAPISPIAAAGVWLFAAQAALLAILAIRPPDDTRLARPRLLGGIALIVLGIYLYPVIGFARSGAWNAAEWFGMAPDPTAIGTLGLVLCGVQNRGTAGGTMLLPLLWCLLSGLTLRGFADPLQWVLFGSVLVATIGGLTRGSDQPRGS